MLFDAGGSAVLSPHEMARAVEVVVLRLIPVDGAIAASDLATAVHASAEEFKARCADFDFFSWARGSLGDLLQSLAKFRLVDIRPMGDAPSSSASSILRTDSTAAYLVIAEQEARRALDLLRPTTPPKPQATDPQARWALIYMFGAGYLVGFIHQGFRCRR